MVLCFWTSMTVNDAARQGANVYRGEQHWYIATIALSQFCWFARNLHIASLHLSALCRSSVMCVVKSGASLFLQHLILITSIGYWLRLSTVKTGVNKFIVNMGLLIHSSLVLNARDILLIIAAPFPPKNVFIVFIWNLFLFLDHHVQDDFVPLETRNFCACHHSYGWGESSTT